MLFEMPFFGIAPKDYPPEKQQSLIHAKGYRELTKVTLTLPASINNLSSSMKKVIQESIVHISAGDTYLLTLEFDDGKQGNRQDFTDLFPVIIHW